MDTKARKKLIVDLASERDELERQAGDREKHAQRLSGPQKNAAQLEARSLRQKAKEVGRRWAELTKEPKRG